MPLSGVQVYLVWSLFFFKQKTAYEIKECDWSSDVCSSDLTLWRRPLAREECQRRDGTRKAQNDDGDRKRAADEHADVAGSAAGQTGHGKSRRRTGDDEQADHGGVSDQTQRTEHLQPDNRHVAQIQDDGERHRRQHEQVAWRALADGVTSPKPYDREQGRDDEPHGAEEGDRNAERRAVRAQIYRRAAESRADVAKARIRRIVEKMVVNVRRRNGSGESHAREHARQTRLPLRHWSQRVLYPLEGAFVNVRVGKAA